VYRRVRGTDFVTEDSGPAKGLRSVRDFARKEWPLRGSPADVRSRAILRSAGGR